MKLMQLPCFFMCTWVVCKWNQKTFWACFNFRSHTNRVVPSNNNRRGTLPTPTDSWIHIIHYAKYSLSSQWFRLTLLWHYNKNMQLQDFCWSGKHYVESTFYLPIQTNGGIWQACPTMHFACLGQSGNCQKLVSADLNENFEADTEVDWREHECPCPKINKLDVP